MTDSSDDHNHCELEQYIAQRTSRFPGFAYRMLAAQMRYERRMIERDWGPIPAKSAHQKKYR